MPRGRSQDNAAPTGNGDVIDGDTALVQQFLNILVGQAIPQDRAHARRSHPTSLSSHLRRAGLAILRVRSIAGKRLIADGTLTAGEELGAHLDCLDRACGACLQCQAKSQDDDARDEQRP